MKHFLLDNIGERNGRLTFASMDVEELADRYGTPLYLMDEDRIRSNCRRYTGAFRTLFPKGFRVLYAGKACAVRALYPLMREEGLGIDVVSSGEIYTAQSAGFPMEQAFFHGNNKTDEDIAFAMENGVGFLVSDSREELERTDALAASFGRRQKVLLRITPGIDPHTYEAVSTGQVDSKFGFSLSDGQAEQAVRLALSSPNLELCGYHCHIGSQVFEEDVWEKTLDVMLSFAADMARKTGFRPSLLDLGGGFGVRYVDSDPVTAMEDKLASVARAFHEGCERYGLAVPTFVMEPGRSIVADAGLTVYTVGSVKTIPGFRTYVSVDGGMTDNPRYALYRSRYTVLPVELREGETMPVTLAGRCCESGDLIAENVPLPADIRRGDRVAVATTGAYHYSMASNYNRLPRPAMVMIRSGEARVVVERETLRQLIQNDRL